MNQINDQDCRQTETAPPSPSLFSILQFSNPQLPFTNYQQLITDHFSLPFTFLVNNFHIAHKMSAGGSTIGRITTTSQMRKFAIP